MTINAGKMNRRIQFFDGADNPVDQQGRWFWCQFQTLEGVTRYQAQSVWQTVTAEIRMRYVLLDDINLGPRLPLAGDRVRVEGGKYYGIKSVVDTDERHEEVVLVVEELMV